MPKRALVLLTATLLATAAAAAPGVDSERIVFGQTACFTGPNAKLGLMYRTGILAAFAERNAGGGVKGRTLELLSFDDAYEPELAAANAERFISEGKIFSVIGAVGTPTSKRIVPMLRSAEIPFVGPLTGADFLRDAELYPHVVNLRASYFEESELLVEHMIELGAKRFGIIYQDDAFGRAALRDYKLLLDARNIPLLARNAYTRNTHAVHTSLFSLEKADLDAILLVGSYPANSTIINLANSLDKDYFMASLSFVFSYELRKLLDQVEGEIIVTEVVPDATDTDKQIIQRYLQAIARESEREGLSDAINEVSLEGYILGRFVIAVLDRMEGEWTRDKFLRNALSSEPVLLDDWTLEFQPGTNSGSHYIRLIHVAGDTAHAAHAAHAESGS